MKYLHTMVRVLDLDAALKFYVTQLGLVEIRRTEHEQGRFTLVFLGPNVLEPILELTYNWDQTEPYNTGRSFGHLAFGVQNINNFCERLHNQGILIQRPPRDGRMAFLKSPDGVSIEILQLGDPLTPKEPWLSMPNQGEW